MEIPLIIEKGMYVLLGVLVTAITSHFLSKSKELEFHKIISFNAAAEKFRRSFDDALLRIDQGDMPIHELLRWQYTSHKVSMWNFKYYFIGKARSRFEKTWSEYEKYYNDHSNEDSMPVPDISFNTIATLDEYRMLIEKLIKYTIEGEYCHNSVLKFIKIKL